MKALVPASVIKSQPVDGATPPTVFTRWMNVVAASVLPPVGPRSVPTVCKRTQATAPGSTNLGSTDEAFALAHTRLESTESCQVARTVLPSNGLGLKKCEVSCAPPSNSVACGVNNT